MVFIPNVGIAFEKIALQHADRTALFYPVSGERISYHQLQLLVTRIAAHLWGKGLRQGQVAAIFHDKSPAAFAAMLACLRLGIVYANVDPGSPWVRLRKMLATCQPDVIINGFQELPFSIDLAAHGYAEIVHLRALQTLSPTHLDLPDGSALGAGTPAYIMFTSGSTGTPKGAVMSHANLLWFSAWARARFAVTPQDVLSNVNPMFFDNAVFDFYTAILSGAALIPITSAQVHDTRQLVRLINGAGCTLWFSVPSLLVYLLTTRALSAADFPSIRKIIFGGEGFPKNRLRQLYTLFGARAQLENVYGPTECTCICSAHTIVAEDFEDMSSLAPLGLLAANFNFEILPLEQGQQDSQDELTCGELFLRGPQVGLGYYNDPQRSAMAFTQNPQHALYADVGYRCGDIVYKDARGRLHFKGRVDNQIKHMGYRIELEEIEAALSSLDAVSECAVIYQALAAGHGQIIAFAVLSTPKSSDDVLIKIGSILPSYMLPRRVIILDMLPKNANGKIDRVALRAMYF